MLLSCVYVMNVFDLCMSGVICVIVLCLCNEV